MIEEPEIKIIGENDWINTNRLDWKINFPAFLFIGSLWAIINLYFFITITQIIIDRKKGLWYILNVCHNVKSAQPGKWEVLRWNYLQITIRTQFTVTVREQ
jgi:hypothetical protein